METVDYLVIGAGMSGLGFANWIREDGRAPSVLVVEAEDLPGGYCRTVVQHGFVWDYSGHFFHFRHPDIEAWLRARMPGEDVRTVRRRALIRFGDVDVDFPFQKNIHQLPRADFIDCLHDLYFATGDAGAPHASFAAMLYARLGRGIADRFLIPYNEKLYATDLGALDPDAMGRFFPHADVASVIRNMKRAPGEGDGGYNETFTYPAGGAVQYVHALLRDLPAGTVACGERVVAIDLARKVATTTKREIGFGRVVSSAPLPALARTCGLTFDEPAFSWNSVLVYNLGFDRKGRDDVHWMYFPDRATSFYRVGWYDNIMGADRMSLYVEIGAPAGTRHDVDATLARVLADLAREQIVDDHRLVAWHSVVLDPAYVHITTRSLAETARVKAELAAAGVHAVGRYGGWTYCSIEDNLVETRALAAELVRGGAP